jgi:hypothetical protein
MPKSVVEPAVLISISVALGWCGSVAAMSNGGKESGDMDPASRTQTEMLDELEVTFVAMTLNNRDRAGLADLRATTGSGRGKV